jgi:hypothetical protein
MYAYARYAITTLQGIVQNRIAAAAKMKIIA